MFTKLQLASLLALLVGAAAVTEPGSGIDFKLKSKFGALISFGLRKKGPVKVYAVGMYEDVSSKAKGFNLQMLMGVSSEKMTNSLKDALKPRCSDEKALVGFESVMHKGLPHGCPKGTTLEFGTGGGKLSLTVDDKAIGSVASKPLAKAFADIYCDHNAVCKLQKIPFATGVSIGETHAVQAEEDFADPIFTGRQDGGGSAKLGKSHIKQENIADPIFTGRNDN